MPARPTEPSAGPWLQSQHAELAVARILDAAGEAFAERGVASARIHHVAERAGCSRATVYRYFKNRVELRMAYLRREAMVLVAALEAHVADRERAADIVVDGMVFALEAVRANPTLRAWFAPSAQGTTAVLASTSSALFGLVEHFLERLLERATDVEGLRAGIDRGEAAEWLVRSMLSLLSVPGPRPRDREEEAAFLRRFLVPALFG